MEENSENRKKPTEESFEGESGKPKDVKDVSPKDHKDVASLSRDQKEEERDQARRDAFQELLIKSLPYIFRTLLIIIGVIIIVRVLHLVDGFGFARLVWIEKETLNMIDKILAFIFGGIIARYFPKIFPEKPSLKQ